MGRGRCGRAQVISEASPPPAPAEVSRCCTARFPSPPFHPGLDSREGTAGCDLVPALGIHGQVEVKFRIHSVPVQGQRHRLPSSPALTPRTSDTALSQHGAHHTPGHLAPCLDPQKALAHQQAGPPFYRGLSRVGSVPQASCYSQAAGGLGPRLELSQPRGRSLSRQCDFPPPGFVAMATLHKLRLWASPLEKSIPS